MFEPDAPIGGAPIGVFDSGVGGLSVLRALWSEVPEEATLYLADQVHVPYGSKSLEEVRSFAEGITRFLLEQGAKLIVVACNAASAAALQHLRQVFPAVPFVGMEPALKPAAQSSLSRVVGVLATPVTFQGELYASLVDRFANGIQLLQHTCPGLVGQIEAGDLDGPSTRSILEDAIFPMLAQGADRLVLGCTHYPFVIPLIQEIAGPGIQVIDPAPAVARQTRRLLEERRLLREASEQTTIRASKRSKFLTSGDPLRLQAALVQLLGVEAEVQSVEWVEERLILRRRRASR